jgi:RHS repeat-associated protein
MKTILTILSLGACLLAFGQNPSQNFIKNKVYKVPSTGTVTTNDTLVTVQYFDGLGRPVQTIAVKAGGNGQDLVSQVAYDNFGREIQQYLPYSNVSQSVPSPNFRDPVALLNSQQAYYAGKFPADAVSGNAYAYTEVFPEASPLGRIEKSAAPGKDWAGITGSVTDHTIKTVYTINTTEDKVRLFNVKFTTTGGVENTESTKLTSSGYYAQNQLLKTITKDENWQPGDGKNRTVEEFKDKEGHLLLKRTYNNDEPHDTYYVYDVYNKLTYVIPPLASDDIVNEVVLLSSLGRNFPWTHISSVDRQLADEYEKVLQDYDNSDILSIDLSDKYGGQGGFSVATDSNNKLILNLNITTASPMPYRTGALADLRDLGSFPDSELGRIEGTGYKYIFSIRKNSLYLEGDGGKVPSLNISFTSGQPLSYSQNYAWTTLVEGDPQIEKDYDTAISGLPNSQILNTYTANPYGAQGGISISLDEEDNLSVALGITSTTPLNLQRGAVFPLNISRRIADGIIGSVTGNGYSYEFSVKDNNLVVNGSGTFTAISFTGIKGKPLTTYLVNQEVVEGLCYIYHYDYRNRMVEKHIPDNGWTHLVYDKLDRVLMTQDENQRLVNNWLFSKYDALDRPVYTGQVTDIRTRAVLQSDITAASLPLNEARSATPFTNAGATVHYTNNAFPLSGIDLFSVQYYDTYGFDMAGITKPSSNIFGAALLTSGPGLATGSKVRTLDTQQWATTVMGYDTRGRVVWNKEVNAFLASSTQVESNLTVITGLPVQVNTTHTGAQTVSFNDYYYYDYMNRLLRQSRKIGSQATQLITFNKYDELGQLVQKKVGGTDASTYTAAAGLQTVDYSYNIRGWLKGINDASASLASSTDLFAFSVNYNTPSLGGTALYNGNISETHWKSKTDNKIRSYSYSYDALNRLTDANYKDYNYYLVQFPTQKEKYTEGGISYDKNGNIEHLERYGLRANNTTDKIDVLTYNYMPYSNKLRGVNDTADSEGFNNAATGTNDDYIYDTLGNLKTDQNKGITGITYNHLNLPKKVTFTGTNKFIEYTYDAAGTKLQKKVTEGTVTITVYDRGFQSNTTTQEHFFPQPEGFCIKESSGNYSYIYQYKDHLGNVRLSYKDADGNGAISQAEIQEQSNYYAFGLQHKGYLNATTGGNVNKYKYNGKELQEELGLAMYDYGARNYDPALGRWMNIDPLAEVSRRWSPYTYAYDNPVYFVDPDGMKAEAGQSGVYYDWDEGKYIDSSTGKESTFDAAMASHESKESEKGAENENNDSFGHPGIVTDGILGEFGGEKPGKWDLLSEKSFRFKKPTTTANYREARITNIYFTIVDPSTGTIYENSFALEIGVPITSKNGKFYSQKAAVDASAMVLNAVATQIATLEEFLSTPQIREMTLSNATLPYIFATFAQYKLNQYIPGSSVTANTYRYNVTEKSAVYVNWFTGILERLE